MKINLHRSNFFYLLCSLIIYPVFISIAPENPHGYFWLSVLFSFIIIFCLLAIVHRRYFLISIMIIGALALISHWMVYLLHPGFYFYIILYVTNILFLIIITAFILYTITTHRQITEDSLFGAICGYFLIGFIWSSIYLLIATINPGAFSQPMITPFIHLSAQRAFYFSFTTITTLGYGDVLPVSHMAKTCSWLEAVIGQIYLAVWISQLVGLRIAQKR